MSSHFTESVVEAAALEGLAELGYTVVDDRAIEPEKPAAERASFLETVLAERL